MGAGLAGRRTELRVVTNVLTGGADVAALLVVGEAGVGKSRLVAVSADAVRAQVAVLAGGCLPLSKGLPFLPVVDVLRGMASVDRGQLLKAALAECPSFVRTELARLLPELEDAGEQRTESMYADWRRQRLLDAVRQALCAAAALQRVAMVIEDVHWADRSTLELLDYLLSSGHETGVPVLLTSRSEEAPVTDWLERASASTLHAAQIAPSSRAKSRSSA
jgi:predicted ATPase